MRRYAIFLMLLCMHCIARGQTGFGYRYWFDNDCNTVHTGYSAADKWQIEADLDGLDESLHAIHIQVMDDKGVESTPVTRFFVKTRDNSVEQGYYWFDNGRDVKQLIGQVQGTFSIDVSALPEGFHTFYFQVVGKDGSLSSIVSRPFYKVVVPESARYRCWVDDEPSTMTVGKYTGAPVLVDVSQISEGYHVMRVQIEGATPSAVVSRPFVKVPQTEGVEYLKCLSIVDGQLYREENVPSTGGIIDWDFDVSGLPQGFHQMQVQVITPSGAATSTYDAFFLRTTTHAEMDEMRCVYSIDGNEFNTEAGSMSNGVFHCDLDVAHLSDGLHRLTYMLTNGKGVETKIQSQFFIKTPVGGNGITQYWYWLNENEAEKTVVKLKENANPYQLIGLLPVESVPIRSSLFHFEVDEEQGPMVYAKNEFHIRFYDATGRLVDATKEYVDPEVKEKVTEVSPLLQIQTLTKPGENEIRWYKFVAQVGDSVAFKTNKACSINVFAANGAEIYAASGSESVNYGGSVIAEDGTYYVALHDVTSTAGTDITLDFFHIGKYVVLEYSPSRIGMLGESAVEVELFGNGYEKLKNAYLQSSSNTLIPDSIAVLCRTDMKMLYTFYGNEEFGSYDIVLEFEEDGVTEFLTIEDAITIEEGQWADPEVTVSSERSLARPYPVKVTVKNNSNVGMMYVPLNIAFDNVEKFEKVDFMNFDISIPDTTLVGDYRPFFVTEDFLSEGIRALVMYLFIPQLDPGETKEYILGFTGSSHARFNMYAWAGEALNHPNPGVDTLTNIPSMWYYLEEYGYLNEEPSIQNAQAMRNEMSRIARLRRAAGSANRVANSAVGTGMAIGGIVNGLRRNSYEASLRNAGISSDDPLYGDIMGHVGPMPTPDEIRGGLFGLWRFSRRTRPCPRPNPTEILNPGDPNDIIGYNAESGSKYIKEGLVDVGYTIQFENDPEIATASAHQIVVKDTLDGNLFDLSTFAATGVLLGDKRLDLNGEKSFVKTIDMRTRINVIAEVSLDYDETQGIATWTIRSLDPMTMEETWDYMQGVLPVNYDGNGQGELYFDIKLREGLADGTEIPNRASIVFDFEEAIITPTWMNTIDNTLPSSEITSIEELNDTVLRINWSGSDSGSNIYKYALYVQEGEDGEWSRVVSDTAGVYCDYRYYRDIDYGFCVLATDSAGNVESREWVRKVEFMREYIAGDADRSGTVNLLDLNLTLSHILGNEVGGCDMLQMDANGDGSINVLDINAILQIILDADGEGAAQRKRDNGVIRIINTKVI